MNYVRRLPDDVLREAHLLRCLGLVLVAMKEDRAPGLEASMLSGSAGFEITRSGREELVVSNLEFTTHSGEPVVFLLPHDAVSTASPPSQLVLWFRGACWQPLSELGVWRLPNSFFTEPDKHRPA